MLEPDHEDIDSLLEGTLLDRRADRRTLLKGGALASLASFFSFGPLSLRAAGASKAPAFRIIEERLVPIPAALRPGIDSATRAFARKGFHIPRHFATYRKAAIGDQEFDWIEYHVASDAVNGRKAMIHAGLSKTTGPMVGGSITTWSDLRATHLEAYEYGPAGFRKQAVAELNPDGEVSTVLAATAFHELDAYAGLAPGMKKINRVQDALDQGVEACSCSCTCGAQATSGQICNLYCILVCGILGLICPWCGVICAAICYVGCTFTIPCEVFCAQCGCGSMSSTQCDYCCNTC